MSSSLTDPTATAMNSDSTNNVATQQDKGKEKVNSNAEDESMEEEMEEEEDEDGDEDEEEEEEEEEETFEEIDPSAIIGRRTRGVKVDYNSKEALAKAGLQDTEREDSEDEMDNKMEQ